ncbi:MAG TPA: hypothetical protein VMU87_05890 [Stellaceae bacterium]|nr:hypothetical protein [Stellaceae bacterium]
MGDDETDLAPGEREVLVFEKGGDPLFHLDAACRERAGLGRQQADLERRALRERRAQRK